MIPKIRTVPLLLVAMFTLFGVLVISPAQARQQDEPPVPIGMSLSSNRVTLGEPFILEVTVEGERDLGRPTLSLPAHFRITPMGGPSRQSSTYQSVINGRVTTRTRSLTSYRYELIARSAGSFTIPGAIFIIDGREFATEAVSLRVVEPAPTNLLIVNVDVDDPEPFAGQPVLVTLSMIFPPGAIADPRITAPSDLDAVMSAPVTEPAPRASTIEFLNEPTTYEATEEIYMGRRAVLVRVQRYIIPARPGELAIGPIAMYARIGGSRFSRGESITAVSEPVSIRVRPLPREGRPRAFSGLVGGLQIDTTISPESANVGDPMTLRAIVRTALPQRIELDDLQLTDRLSPDFQFAGDPPKISYTRDAAIIETTIRPTSDAIKEFPPLELAFFDPETASYRTARSASIPLTIRAAREVGLADAIGIPTDQPPPSAARALIDLVDGLAPSIPRLGALRDRRTTVMAVVSNPVWIVAVTAPPAIYLAALLAVRFRQMRTSPGAERQRALADARNRLHSATDAGEIGVALAHCIAAAMGRTHRSLTPMEAERLVLHAGATESKASELRSLMELCEGARFSGVRSADPSHILRDQADALYRSIEPSLSRFARNNLQDVGADQ